MTTTLGGSRALAAAMRWAADQPDAMAATAADGDLTFRELAIWTGRIAGALRDAGVGRKTPVGLAAGRSRLAVPALLAVWRLGAVAVPLDERHPADRLGFVLRDASVGVVVAAELPAHLGVARLQKVDPSSAAVPVDADVPLAQDDRAYVVYTSGSTGWPKGVEIGHGALGVLLDALSGLGLPAGGLGITAVSPAFDGWLWCALLYLLHGQGMATLDPIARDLGDAVAEVAPTTVCLTPSLLAACADRLAGVELVVSAGEPCPADLAVGLTAGHRVLNVYGPTEATIAATWADSARGDDVRTIGRPLPGHAAYVLDDDRQPVSTGTPGELYLGGRALADGYLNRPDLTAERFVADPFAGAGAVMYRTGDVVLARPDGQLEYGGRRDDQVKIRGTRVELGEVERVAAEEPGVRSAAAFVTAAGEALGVAVVPAAGFAGPGLATAVRERCGRRLPAAAVPTVVDVVATMPTTPAGKLDRAALARESRIPDAGGRAPATDRERAVCDAWAAVLERSVDDVESDFFVLGGHSLLAARVVGALRRSTGLPVSVGHLFATPTPRGLAEQLDRLAAEAV